MAEELVNVTALKAFPLRGAIQKPGPAKVPASKVARLVEKKIIAPVGGEGTASQPSPARDERFDSLATRLGSALSVERQEGESTADYLERLAEASEGGDSLPEDFPHRADLVDGGFGSLPKLRAASDDELLALQHVGKAGVKKIREALGE